MKDWIISCVLYHCYYFFEQPIENIVRGFCKLEIDEMKVPYLLIESNQKIFDFYKSVISEKQRHCRTM